MHTRNAVRIHPNCVPMVALVLQRIGFKDPIFQAWGIGQRFGLARPLTSLLEWHVRGFADGRLDSEVEISRGRLQHLMAKPGAYYSALLEILRQHDIPYRVENNAPPDANYVCLPELFGRKIPIEVPDTPWPKGDTSSGLRLRNSLYRVPPVFRSGPSSWVWISAKFY